MYYTILDTKLVIRGWRLEISKLRIQLTYEVYKTS